jgi:hypothetical protein
MQVHRGHGDRPEKCPVLSCKYAIKGFARKYDQRRHTLTHFQGTLLCDFCPGAGSSNEINFDRVDMFKQHFTSVHDVEQVTPRGRGKSKHSSMATKLGKCSVCLEDFENAQHLYDHLDGCIFDVLHETANINRDDLQTIAELNQRGFKYIECIEAYFDANRHINVAVELLVERHKVPTSKASATQKRLNQDNALSIPDIDERPTRFLRVEMDSNDGNDYMRLKWAMENEPGFVQITSGSDGQSTIGFVEFETPNNAYNTIESLYLDPKSYTRSCTKTVRYVEAGDAPWLNPHLSEIIALPKAQGIRSPLERLVQQNQSTLTTLPASLTASDEPTSIQHLVTNQPNPFDPSDSSTTSEALQRLAQSKDYSIPARLKEYAASSSLKPIENTNVDPSKEHISGKGSAGYDPWRDQFD